MLVYNFQCVLKKLKELGIKEIYRRPILTNSTKDIEYTFEINKKIVLIKSHLLSPKLKTFCEDGFIYGSDNHDNLLN